MFKTLICATFIAIPTQCLHSMGYRTAKQVWKIGSATISSEEDEIQAIKLLDDAENAPPIVQHLSSLDISEEEKIDLLIMIKPLLDANCNAITRGEVLKAAIFSDNQDFIKFILGYENIALEGNSGEFFRVLLANEIIAKKNDADSSISIDLKPGLGTDSIGTELLLVYSVFKPRVSLSKSSFDKVITALRLFQRLKPQLPRDIQYLILSQPVLQASLCKAYLFKMNIDNSPWESCKLRGKLFPFTLPLPLATSIFNFLEQGSNAELVNLIVTSQAPQLPNEEKIDPYRYRLIGEIAQKRRSHLATITGIHAAENPNLIADLDK